MRPWINLDIFAGGGGASVAMERAGFPPNVAVNHDREAIAVHAANHPNCRHICQDVFEAKPLDVTQGAPVLGAWFSPDCTHHSKAKGGKPLDGKRRALAWVVRDYAAEVGPQVIWLENVEEFADWGPLGADHRPIRDRRGETFTQWCNALEALGYRIGHEELSACDYGAPTTRKRLFLCARRDGAPIVRPRPTHARGGAGGLQPWRSAAEVIDFSRDTPSIFWGRDEARTYYERTGIRIQRPLADRTMARIAKGIWKYTIRHSNPFIIPLTHHGEGFRGHGLDEPIRTITGAHRGEMALVAPFLSHAQQGGRNRDATRPMHTICASPKDQNQLIMAFLAQHNNHRGGVPNVGRDLFDPLSTIMVRGTQQGLVTAHLCNLKGTGRSRDMGEPLFAQTAGGWHMAQVNAFLMKYHWTGGQWQDLRDPLHTADAKARFGLVTVHGQDYQIVDIGMRMLTLEELKLGQGLPADYNLLPIIDGKRLTNTSGISKVGNSVSPPPAEAWIRANAPMLEQAVAA